jgi:hypothetical protein
MATRVHAFPHGSQTYLRDRYGFPPYSTRHLGKLVAQGRFPRPFEITPRRKANTEDELDRYAAGVLARAHGQAETATGN